MEKLLFKKKGGKNGRNMSFLRHKGFENKSQVITPGFLDDLFRHPELYPWQVALQQSLLPFPSPKQM